MMDLRGSAVAAARRVGLVPYPSVVPRSNGRLAFVGPLPPAATGIATYHRSVLEGLGRIGFLERRPSDVLWPIERSHRREIPAYELGVFQLGNNLEFHEGVYRMASDAPGLIVLHDLALDGLVYELEASGDPLGRQAMSEAATLLLRMDDPDVVLHEPLRVVWCAAIVRAARGIVVHSEFCRRYLTSNGIRTPIYTVPHPPPESPDAIRRARELAATLRGPLEGRGIRSLLVVPGDINETKQHIAILASAAGLPPEVHLAIVGRPTAAYDITTLVQRYGVQDRVTIRLAVGDDEFLAWLAAADVVIDLRHPHRGEVSGSLIRAMQVGRPTIVSATGAYLDEPEGTVLGVTPGPVDTQELRAAITGLLADPDRRARMGDAAARHVRRLGETEATARGYEEAIEATLELLHDPEHLVLRRWARSLVEMGVDDAMLREGYGASYARALRSFSE
jgi:glycosyltransferase involved in cell wall biosynthesis